jgi:hypothetical protein
MKVPSKRRPNSRRYTSKSFRPYTLALGQLALAWNGLHETLAQLYCRLMAGGLMGKEPVNQHLAVWHALKMDRAQRQILLAAAKSNTWGAVPVTLIDDIKWICGRADVVEDARNDALHSPLWAYERGPRETIVMPVTFLGHVRATKLFDKDLLVEFRWCRDAAIALDDYAIGIADSLFDPMKPWPGRPLWLDQGRPKRLNPHHGRKAERLPPRRPSRG